MHFADGSDLYLIAGARGRLAGLGERGGSVVLEDGKARVAIAPRPGAQWVISAGPFLISSDGGTLDVSFSPSEAGLLVRVVSGAAVVRGPSSPGGAALVAGESLDVRGHGPISVVRSPEGDDD
jgi:ferric-dicitrate binding protein FerR (iron transport regulator)